jgi:hypothetical protein
MTAVVVSRKLWPAKIIVVVVVVTAPDQDTAVLPLVRVTFFVEPSSKEMVYEPVGPVKPAVSVALVAAVSVAVIVAEPLPGAATVLTPC